MKISLAITTYNRFDLTIKSCAQVLDDPRIDDIVILDDKSTDGSFEKLRDYFAPYPHVRVMQQAVNRGMSVSKKDAIAYARNNAVIIFDSDNIMSSEYINALEAMSQFDDDVIYLPVGAMPNFVYTKYSGMTIDRRNVKQFMNDPMFICSLNTCNCLVMRDFYLKTFIEDKTIGCADTINHVFNHLNAGGKLYFVPGLFYDHLVGPQSHFLKDLKYNMTKAKEIEKKINLM